MILPALKIKSFKFNETYLINELSHLKKKTIYEVLNAQKKLHKMYLIRKNYHLEVLKLKIKVRKL